MLFFDFSPAVWLMLYHGVLVHASKIQKKSVLPVIPGFVDVKTVLM